MILLYTPNIAIIESIEIISILFCSLPNIKLTANIYNPVTTNKYL